ncbi:MAG: GGDEF domain-containing protein, partial [Actinobacteria bacterium]|nr:GGDEF domain-containing protein [Actinomycetota bacterium]
MPPRLAVVVVPVYALGIAVAAAAAGSFATSPRGLLTLAGVAGLLAASTLSERYPVPLDGIDAGGVSLGFVFCVATIVLYGWEAGVIVAFAAPIMQLIEHRPPIRVAYNASVQAVVAATAGLAILPIDGSGPVALVAQIFIAAAVHFTSNMVLVSLVIAVSARKPFQGIIRSTLAETILPFALMASAALILVVLWERSPFLSAALVGPLLAIALYQRSTFRELRAMRLALTDPLTGLGNHRHFHDRLERELADSQAQGYPLSLCLVDIDDFKRINDRFGHPGGDKVLAQMATNLRQGGEAFRLGGDEFAILLPGRDEEGARMAAEAIVARIAEV